jgi:hypothetical protein
LVPDRLDDDLLYGACEVGEGYRTPQLAEGPREPAAATRQTELPTSLAINSAPDLSMANPTGRPRA